MTTTAPSNLHIPYSLKNIPTVSLFTYQKMLTARIEEFLSRMRWKLFWYRQDQVNQQKVNTYGFKSSNYPPTMFELKPFEEEVMEMIQKIQMRTYPMNPLQQQMRNDIKKINDCEEVIVQADKTSNLYLIKPDSYSKHLADSITKEYKRNSPTTMEKIDEEAASIASKLELDDRIEAMAKRPAYLTLKDHKEDFPARLSFRLINPCKSNIGKISKSILDRVNMEIKTATGLQQWKSTGETLTWFRKLEKRNTKWLKFDIDSFFPSITKDLLARAFMFALISTASTPALPRTCWPGPSCLPRSTQSSPMKTSR